MEIEVPEKDKVVIRRFNTKGANEGLTATYHGSRSNHQLGGTYTYDNGKSVDSPRFWNAALGTTAASLPSVLHMCIANCFVLTLENGHFTNAEHTSTFVIDNFTRESVVMHRTDFGPSFHGSSVLRGRLSSDGNSIVDGKIEWTSGNTGTWPYQAAWGDALNTVPGCNAERDGTGTCQQTRSASQIGIDGNRIVNEVITHTIEWGIEEFIKNRFRSNQQ